MQTYAQLTSMNMQVGVHTCIRAYIHACMHTCIHTFMHTYIRACMHTNLHAYIRGTPRGTLGYSKCLRAVVLGELLAELVLGLRRAASPAQMWAGGSPFSPGADVGRGGKPIWS